MNPLFFEVPALVDSVMDISFQERYVRRYTKIDDNA